MEEFNLGEAGKLLFNKLQVWVEELIKILPNFLIAVVIIVIGFFVARLARIGMKKIIRKISHNDHSAVSILMERTAYFAVISISVFIALGILNLDKAVTSLLAGAGVIGLALGFAFQEIASNFIAGIFIIIRRPYFMGDLVEVEDYFGNVTDINMRTTHIKTLNGNTVVIPNKTMFTNAFTNYSISPKRRMDLIVGVSYGDDLEKVKKITLECLQDIQGRDKSREIEFFYIEFGSSSINFEVRIWHDFKKQTDFLSVQDQAVMKIKAAFDEHDITIPFPIRTMDFGIKGGQSFKEALDESHFNVENTVQ